MGRKPSTNSPKYSRRFTFKKVVREPLCDAMEESIQQALALWVAAAYAADHPDLFGVASEQVVPVAGSIAGELNDDER